LEASVSDAEASLNPGDRNVVGVDSTETSSTNANEHSQHTPSHEGDPKQQSNADKADDENCGASTDRRETTAAELGSGEATSANGGSVHAGDGGNVVDGGNSVLLSSGCGGDGNGDGDGGAISLVNPTSLFAGCAVVMALVAVGTTVAITLSRT
jgi:hypothetical protein